MFIQEVTNERRPWIQSGCPTSRFSRIGQSCHTGRVALRKGKGNGKLHLARRRKTALSPGSRAIRREGALPPDTADTLCAEKHRFPFGNAPRYVMRREGAESKG